jgi:hypothetical protein
MWWALEMVTFTEVQRRSQRRKSNLMLWSVVRIFLRLQMAHGFLTCTESSKTFSAGDLAAEQGTHHKAELIEDDWYESTTRAAMFILKGASRPV